MENLIEEAKNGNKEAFSQLILEIERDLYKIARTRFSCEADIEDAVQETILQAFKSIKTLRKPKSFKAWIIKVLINKCNKIYKKKEKHIKYIEDITEDIGMYDNNDTLISNLDFYKLIKDLNYKERITIVLYYSEDLTTKEIGKILKESESTIRNRLSRTRIKIKENFKKGGNYEQYRWENKKYSI